MRRSGTVCTATPNSSYNLQESKSAATDESIVGNGRDQVVRQRPEQGKAGDKQMRNFVCVCVCVCVSHSQVRKMAEACEGAVGNE
jgi:hypothetical protein